ncbi:MAG: GNAT family N-acetyltransferase [Planctomycetota bacterium]
MHTRSATRADLPAICDVVFAVGREYGYEPEPEGADLDLFEQVDRYFEEGGLLRVLLDGDEVVGVLGLVREDAQTTELRKLYLLPRVRGGGHGRAFLEEAIAFARRRGAERLILQSTSRFERALTLYERAGFRQVNGEMRSPTCDRMMELQLRSGL